MKKLDQQGKEMIAINGIFREVVHYSLPQYRYCDVETISTLIHANNPSFDPLDPNSKIMFLGTEEADGKTRFDSYYALSELDSDGEIACFINIEVQGKKEIYQKAREKVYLTRIIQEQKDAIRKMDYANIKGAVSIWIYPNMNQKQEGKIIIAPMTSFDYTEGVIGNEPLEMDFSMMVVSIYLGESDNPLIQLLNHCFGRNRLEVKAKSKYLKENYGIDMESEVRDMCTLDEYVMNEGIMIGEVRGEEKTMIAILKNLMKKFNIGLKEAMNIIDMNETDQMKYVKLISENEINE